MRQKILGAAWCNNVHGHILPAASPIALRRWSKHGLVNPKRSSIADNGKRVKPAITLPQVSLLQEPDKSDESVRSPGANREKTRNGGENADV